MNASGHMVARLLLLLGAWYLLTAAVVTGIHVLVRPVPGYVWIGVILFSPVALPLVLGVLALALEGAYNIVRPAPNTDVSRRSFSAKTDVPVPGTGTCLKSTVTCPRCDALLATDNALLCVTCGYKWFNCPSCHAEWHRGERTCRSCGISIEDDAKD